MPGEEILAKSLQYFASHPVLYSLWFWKLKYIL
jgi:hypothetical protein